MIRLRRGSDVSGRAHGTRSSSRCSRKALQKACFGVAALAASLPDLGFCGMRFAAAASAEPVPRTANPLMESAMQSVEYSRAVAAMSEVMATAEEEARDFVNEKAEELGEDGAVEAALAYGFEAFDSDADGKLIGQELRVLLEVSGREIPADMATEIDATGFECDFEEFKRLYERTERSCDSDDGTCAE
mmetsp:Transcript_49287/g.110588  ORF Transcript_49287/g.110588 Transcript_49287/m.110588 type:complete len:189 (+) Transcript_49287:40-606(+)